MDQHNPKWVVVEGAAMKEKLTETTKQIAQAVTEAAIEVVEGVDTKKVSEFKSLVT
jgi:hypothetical protein